MKLKFEIQIYKVLSACQRSKKCYHLLRSTEVNGTHGFGMLAYVDPRTYNTYKSSVVNNAPHMPTLKENWEHFPKIKKL